MNSSTANQNHKKHDLNYRKSAKPMYRLFMFLFRSQLNKFSKSVLLAAYEHGFINTTVMHEMAAIIDRRLYPENSKSSDLFHFPGCPSLRGKPVCTCGGGRHA